MVEKEGRALELRVIAFILCGNSFLFTRNPYGQFATAAERCSGVGAHSTCVRRRSQRVLRIGPTLRTCHLSERNLDPEQPGGCRGGGPGSCTQGIHKPEV